LPAIASCSVTAPAAFQSFEGNNVLIISTIDIVVGEDPIGPPDFFNYRGIRVLRFTITSKYRPATNSCPTLTLQNGSAVPSEVCKVTIDAQNRIALQ
jgi:arginine/ornithine N-succinyltransferase beta subunit